MSWDRTRSIVCALSSVVLDIHKPSREMPIARKMGYQEQKFSHSSARQNQSAHSARLTPTFDGRADIASRCPPLSDPLLSQIWMDNWTGEERCGCHRFLQLLNRSSQQQQLTEPASRPKRHPSTPETELDGTRGRRCSKLLGPERQRYRFLFSSGWRDFR